jgi:HAMP domain-containing protein
MLLGTSFKNAKIGAKFNMFLIFVLIVSISLSGAALSTVLQHRSQAEVTSKALILMQAINAVRSYTQERVNPLLAPQLVTEPEFIPETVPAFSAREVFENLRQNEEHKNFFYKEATLNPTNLRDKADTFETTLVARFHQEQDIQEISGFRNLAEGKIFYIARPLAITQQSCLRCHSTPDVAPKSLLATYGKDHGFGWKLGDIVGAQIISVPAEAVFANARQSFYWIIGVLFSIFTLLVLFINVLLRRTVIQRIQKISKTAQAISIGNLEANFPESSQDEIGKLAIAFNRMKSSLEVAMRLLKQPGAK